MESQHLALLKKIRSKQISHFENCAKLIFLRLHPLKQSLTTETQKSREHQLALLQKEAPECDCGWYELLDVVDKRK